MVNTLLSALLLASLSCQQGERRESAGDVAASLLTHPPPVPTPDADVRAAQTELADGHAWLATRKVIPALRASARRTPEAVLVAARAAAGWGGWSEVQRLLAGEPWLGTRFDGEGFELLARSALERAEATEARAHAEAALRARSEAAPRAIRLVLLARALDRLDERDSAAAMYRLAADALPIARDWLLLRAAGATRDADARRRLYRSVRLAPARVRVAHTEAQALERSTQLLAAAAAYETLGDMPSAYRLRLTATTDNAKRGELRSGLLRFIARADQSDDLQRAIQVLDTAFRELNATAELLVARSAAAAGIAARAVDGFARVPLTTLTDADVVAWARALVAVGKASEAASRIAARRFDAASAAEADYVRAHALLRAGQGSAARRVLERLIASRRNTRQAADARFLLGDLEADAGRDASARDYYLRACTHTPTGTRSDDGCFRAGIVSFALGDVRRAAMIFDDLPKRFPNSPEVLASTYWAGRAWERAGNATLARVRWRSAATREPLSYYASASAKRVGVTPWTPSASELPRSPQLQTTLARSAVLAQLGMDTEERYEYDAIERDTSATATAKLIAGAALLDRGQVPRAIRMGWRALSVTSRDSTRADQRAYLLIYPLLRKEALLAHARTNNLDPALVAGVIRQESSWHPGAVSRAGARGLMQVLPSVGKQVAQSRRYPMWDPALLFDPEVSLELGTAHLRAALSQQNGLPRALAAYNAGASRVRRWVRRTGAQDPELFIERIPFVETRDYVRIVLRNTEIYRSLHALSR